MKKSVLLLGFLLPLAAVCQTATQHKNAIQFEALGLGRYGALAYERLLYGGQQANVYGRAGFTMVRYVNFENKFKPDMLMPLEVSLAIGQKRHHLEVSFGQIIESYSRFSTAASGAQRKLEISLSTGLGYRYEKPGGRWQYRLMGYRILDNYEIDRLWAGISAGYKFSAKR